MPKLGLTMSEGLIAEWLVAPGDEVAEGQVLFVVETDKISNEIEAPAAGRITQVLVAAGETVDVGTPVAFWTGPGQGAVPVADTPPAAPTTPAPFPVVQNGSRIRVTPFARRLAERGGIALGDIAGSGPRGRIQAEDVRAALAEKPAGAKPLAKARDLRGLIAARVSRSKAEVPHFYLTADAVFDALIALRADLNADPAAPGKLSVTAFLAAAAARALKLMPEANVVWRDGQAVPLPAVAVGIAVEAPGGVMAPVIAVRGGIHVLARDLDAAIERARTGRLGAADMGEAALGISNVGMFGVRALAPIIDPDQTFMLGVGAPHVAFRLGADGQPKAVQEVTLTLSCDHRAIDGAAAARFLAAIVDLLEHPARLLIAHD